MADATSNITIKIGSTGDLAAFETARQQADVLRESVSAVRDVLATFGVGLSFAALGEFMRGALEYGAALGHLAEQAQVSTSALQALAFTALDSGQNQEKLAQQLAFLNKSMGLAAQGSAAQNKAITDLGLNTADLLALPVDEQLTAIARAYVTAKDPTKAYADVVELLGRQTAKTLGLIVQLGTSGPETPWWIVSDEDIKKLDHEESTLHKIFTTILALGATAIAEGPGAASRGDPWSNMVATELGKKTPSELSAPPPEKPDVTAPPKPDALAQIAQREADLAALPEMIELHKQLAKALKDEGEAYQTPLERAKELRDQARDLEFNAAQPVNLYDTQANEQQVKDKIEASKLRAEASNIESAELAKQAEDMAKIGLLDQQITDLSAKKLTLDEQLAAKSHELLANEQARAALDPKSETYAASELKLTEQEFEIKKQLMAIEVAIANEQLQRIEKGQQAANKGYQIAMASIEHDWNTTDNQKWQEKLDLINQTIAEQQGYLAQFKATANDQSQPEATRNKAAQDAQSTQTVLDGLQGQKQSMGPDPTSFTQNFSKGLNQLQNQWGSLQQNMASGLTGVIGGALNTVDSNIEKLIMHTETWRQAMANIARTIESSVVSAFVQMGAKWIATQILMAVEGKSAATANAAAMVPIAAAESATWAAPAALATIASYGGAAVAAPGEILAAMAATQGLALAHSGGFFPGDEQDAAFIGHGGEFVWSAPAVRNIGADNLERAHQAARQGVSGASGGNAGRSRQNGSGPIHIHVHSSPEEALSAAARTTQGRSVLANLTKGVVRELA